MGVCPAWTISDLKLAQAASPCYDFYVIVALVRLRHSCYFARLDAGFFLSTP